MDIKRKIMQDKGLTPTEQQLGQTVLAMGENVRGLSIKEFARQANVSVASIHRFCKKLGLEGFKELKVELVRAALRADSTPEVDIDFPFDATSTPAQVMERMESLYQTTLAETQELLDPAQLDYAAKLVLRAGTVDIYTGITCIQRECFAIACSLPAKARRATTMSRPKCARRSPRAPTMLQSSSPTAALPPTSRIFCQFSAVGMSRS